MVNKVAVYMRLSESCRYFVEFIFLCRYHMVLRVRVVVCESWCFYKASLMGPGFNQSIKMVFVWHACSKRLDKRNARLLYQVCYML